MNPEQLAAAIADITPRFVSILNDEALLLTAKKELAPTFMRAFRAWRSTIENGHDTLSDFVRVLRPTNDDKAHKKAVNAANYLRQLTLHKVEKPKPSPVARAIKPFLELFDEGERPAILAFIRERRTKKPDFATVLRTYGQAQPAQPAQAAPVAPPVVPDVVINGADDPLHGFAEARG